MAVRASRSIVSANPVSEACRSRYPSQVSLTGKLACSGQAPGTEIPSLTGDVDHLDVIPKSLPDQLGQLSFSYWSPPSPRWLINVGSVSFDAADGAASRRKEHTTVGVPTSMGAVRTEAGTTFCAFPGAVAMSRELSRTYLERVYEI